MMWWCEVFTRQAHYLSIDAVLQVHWLQMRLTVMNWILAMRYC